MTRRHRQEDACQVEGVEQLVATFATGSGATVHKKRNVEVSGVRDDRAVSDEGDQLCEHLIGMRGGHHVGIANTGELLNRPRDSNLRPDERLERREHFVPAKADRTNLDHSVQPRAQARGLDIESNERAIHCA